ncbi:MAG: hypothetical protein KKB81_04260 [Candidatus Margulisbacteria bacterium]|nr:hypothetical protein [Candidatus Margulisiibacteriota bacterium]MBU1021959.1 hypothetical protein [Candidatus Margulisiibacteriota bacterium]MBU1728938.1 hypothetical protein [Candidatus Margulisiibacteriota bacterium]MBU1954744.1 hypothetical protein [Candidatus Margulisiibacteriota bacterium]
MAPNVFTRYAPTRKKNNPLLVCHPTLPIKSGARVVRNSLPREVMLHRAMEWHPFNIKWENGRSVISRVVAALPECQVFLPVRDRRWILREQLLAGRLGVVSLMNGGESLSGFCLSVFRGEGNPNTALLREQTLGALDRDGMLVPYEWRSFEELAKIRNGRNAVPLGEGFPGADVLEVWGEVRNGSRRVIETFDRQAFVLGELSGSPLENGLSPEQVLFRWQAGELRVFVLDAERGLIEEDRILMRNGTVKSRTARLSRRLRKEGPRQQYKPMHLEALSLAFAKEVSINRQNKNFSCAGVLFGLGDPPEARFLDGKGLKVKMYQGGLIVSWNNGKQGEAREEFKRILRTAPNGDLLDSAGKKIMTPDGLVNLGVATRERPSSKEDPFKKTFINVWRLLEAHYDEALANKQAVSPEKFAIVLGKMKRGETLSAAEGGMMTSCPIKVSGKAGSIELLVDEGQGVFTRRVFSNSSLCRESILDQEMLAMPVQGEREGEIALFYETLEQGERTPRYLFSVFYDREADLIYKVEKSGPRELRRYAVLVENNRFLVPPFTFHVSNMTLAQPGASIMFADISIDKEGNRRMDGVVGRTGGEAARKNANAIRDLNNNIIGYWIGESRPAEVDQVRGITESQLWTRVGDKIKVLWGVQPRIPVAALGGDKLMDGDKIILRVEGDHLLAAAPPGDWEMAEVHNLKVVRGANWEIIRAGEDNILKSAIQGIRVLEGFSSRLHLDTIKIEVVNVAGATFEVGNNSAPRKQYQSRKVSLIINAENGKTLFSYDAPVFDGIMEDIAKVVILAEQQGQLTEIMPALQQARELHIAGTPRLKVAQSLFDSGHPLLQRAFNKGVVGGKEFRDAEDAPAKSLCEKRKILRRNLIEAEKAYRSRTVNNRMERDLSTSEYLADVQRTWGSLYALINQQNLGNSTPELRRQFFLVNRLERDILYMALKTWADEFISLGIIPEFKRRIASFLPALERRRQWWEAEGTRRRKSKPVVAMSIEERQQLTEAATQLNYYSNLVIAAEKIISN